MKEEKNRPRDEAEQGFSLISDEIKSAFKKVDT